jgi:hypothetical protein
MPKKEVLGREPMWRGFRFGAWAEERLTEADGGGGALGG